MTALEAAIDRIIITAKYLPPDFLIWNGARRFEKLPAPPASLLGGYSVCDPPDPIPNSDVKPDSADGTIAQAMEE